MPTYYVSGIRPVIMYPFIPVTSQTHRPTPEQPETSPDAVIPSHDMRTLGLELASDRLRMRVADLSLVAEARAKADIRKCPVCPVPHAA